MASNKDEGKSRLASQPLPPPQLSKAAPELVANELASNPSPDVRARSLITTGEADTGTATAAAAPPCAHEKPEGNSATKRDGLVSPLPPPPTTIAGTDVAQQKIEADKRGTRQKRGGAEALSFCVEDCGVSCPMTAEMIHISSFIEAEDGRNDTTAVAMATLHNEESKGDLRFMPTSEEGIQTLTTTKKQDLANNRPKDSLAAWREKASRWREPSYSSSLTVGGDYEKDYQGDVAENTVAESASTSQLTVGGGTNNSAPSPLTDDNDEDVLSPIDSSNSFSRAASSSNAPGDSSMGVIMPSTLGAVRSVGAEDGPGLRSLSVGEPSGVNLVSARLVVDDGQDDDGQDDNDGDDNDGDDDENLKYGVAEEIYPMYCYVGRRRIHQYCVVFVIGLVVAAITVSIVFTLKNRGKKIIHPDGTCGEGNIGNAICPTGECCSNYGFCGDTPEHCGNPPPVNMGTTANATIGPIWSDKICGGYYVDWESNPPIQGIHPNYNMVNLFAARLDGTDGGVGVESGKAFGSITYVPPYNLKMFRADVVAERKADRKRAFLLTVGENGQGFEISDRYMSLVLLESVSRIRDEVGGLDGLEWNTLKDRPTNTSELIWIGQELKRLFPNFVVSASVVAFRRRDMRFCRKAIDEDALDFCSPVFYGGPGLSSHVDVMDLVAEWVESIGQDRVVVGLGVHPTESYFQRPDEAKETYAAIKSLYPDIRGALNWNVQSDVSLKTGFAKDICTV